MRTKQLSFLLALTLLLSFFLAVPASAAPSRPLAQTAPQVKNIIMMIPDGQSVTECFP